MTYKLNFALIAAGLLALTQAGAGVVYEIEVTDHSARKPATDLVRTSVEGRSLKMQFDAEKREGEMIYRGEPKEMIMVDHEDREYTVIDQETIAQIAAQMSQVNQQLAEALKNVPPEQRPMMERMMKQRMPQMQAAPARANIEVVATGERDTHQGYPCVKYEVLEDGVKARELWVTDWDHVEGGDEVVELFKEMAGFFQEMLDALPRFGASGGRSFDDNLFEFMDRMNGFPVVTREFSSQGELTDESVLRSVEARSLGPDEFEPPAGYKRRSMTPR